jgi:hypothetical protein
MKHHCQLKGDIVEAIQILKGAERQDLFPLFPCISMEENLKMRLMPRLHCWMKLNRRHQHWNWMTIVICQIMSVMTLCI